MQLSIHVSRVSAVLRVNFKSYRWVWGRLLFLVLAMLASVTTLSAVLVTNQAARQSYDNASQPLVDNIHYQIVNQQRQLGVSKRDYSQLRRLGYTQLIPVLQTTINLPRDINISLMGIDPFAIDAQQWLEGLTMELGDGDANFAFVHQQFAQKNGWHDGEILRDIHGRQLPPLRLIDGAGLSREIIVDIAWLSDFENQNQLSHLWVQLKPEQSEAVTQLEQDLPKHLRLRALVTGEKAAQLTDAFHLNLIAMSFMCFVVCLFIMTNAAHLLLVSRLERLRCLRQLGISRDDIYAALALEFLVLCLVCASFGLLLGVGLAQALAPTLDSSFDALFSIRLGFEQGNHLGLLALNFSLLVLGSCVALYLPAKQLNAKLAGLKLQQTLSSTSKTTLLKLSCIGVFAAISAVILRLWSPSLLMAFVCIVMLLVAGVCSWLILQPVLLTQLKKRLKPMRWPFIHVLAADSLTLNQRSKLAICAFYLAVAANMGINLMVDSFREATVDWVSQRLAADYYLSDDEPEQLVTWLNQQASVSAVERRDHYAMPFRKNADDQTRQNTAVASLDIIDTISYPSSHVYRQAMKFDTHQHAQAKLWQGFETGDYVLINQQMAYLAKLKLGQKVELGDRYQSFTVAGIYLDYGNPQAQMSLSKQSLIQLNQQASSSSLALAIELKPDIDRETWLQDFKQHFPNAMHYSRKQVIALTLNTFDQTFIITDALNVITLLVAAISLASSMIVIQRESQAQNAVLRCSGISAIKLFWGQLGQYGLLVLLSSLLALPLALGLSEVLIGQINYHAFHWSYPLKVDSSILLSSLSFAWICVLLSCALVLAYQARKPLIEDLRWLS
ncbi:FtsX-like permease family protein [Alginatibacterium sediminis]|nr:FtsX-like permease family protein [Alginatibacterium sediminis]